MERNYGEYKGDNNSGKLDRGRLEDGRFGNQRHEPTGN